MEDTEVIERIMAKYKQEKKSKSEYERNRKLRTLELKGVDKKIFLFEKFVIAAYLVPSE